MMDPAAIEGFVRTYLLSSFDSPAAIPDFHRVMWQDACSDAKRCAWAAPRNFAKSTAITLTLPLFESLTGEASFFLIISDTEDQAKKFLGDIKFTLQENLRLQTDFGVDPSFEKDNETEIVFRCAAGLVCMKARGAEQKLRGLKWRNQRPGRIYIDDAENDEIVSSAARRRKFHDWFLKALLPALSDSGKVRMVGTILHFDSQLQRCLQSRAWRTRCYEAHNDDFSFLLWPERWPRERLEELRESYVLEGRLDAYMQELRNIVLDESESVFRRSDFVLRPGGMPDGPILRAYDLAVSTRTTSDYTAWVDAVVDPRTGVAHIVDARKRRMDTAELVEHIFAGYEEHNFALVGFEKGVIEASIGPFLRAEMSKRSRFIPMWLCASRKDKLSRSASIRARMRNGNVTFDGESAWLNALMFELLRFPRDRFDDLVDAMSLLGQMLDYFGSFGMMEEDEPLEVRVGADPFTGY